MHLGSKPKFKMYLTLVKKKDNLPKFNHDAYV